jgi:hypothetical protein
VEEEIPDDLFHEQQWVHTMKGLSFIQSPAVEQRFRIGKMRLGLGIFAVAAHGGVECRVWWSFAIGIIAVKVRAKTSRRTTSCRSRLPQASSQLHIHHTLPPQQQQQSWYVADKTARRALMLRDYRHEIARRRSQCCSASASSRRQI